MGDPRSSCEGGRLIADALEAWKTPGEPSPTARVMPRMMLGGASMVQRAGVRADVTSIALSGDLALGGVPRRELGVVEDQAMIGERGDGGRDLGRGGEPGERR